MCGVRPVLFDQDAALTAALAQELGCTAGASPAHAILQLTSPCVVWLMLPSGAATEDMITRLAPLLRAGDVLVDGANSMYKDAIRRAASLKPVGVEFMDAGVSGGVHGLANGYCLMVGGSDQALQQVKPYLEILAPAPDTGWLHAGPTGSGHFVKMVHNGIEYGMMQAFAEGFAMLEAKKEFGIDVAVVSELWRHRSVVHSWLLDLASLPPRCCLSALA